MIGSIGALRIRVETFTSTLILSLYELDTHSNHFLFALELNYINDVATDLANSTWRVLDAVHPRKNLR